jgi:phage/plasmid-like protein (TIGR03299 family)
MSFNSNNFTSSSLNWKVDKRPLFDEHGEKLPVFGTFRSDNNFFLGAVSDRYSIIQNEEIFSVPKFVEESGMKLEFRKAGETDGGRGVYCKYKLPFNIDVKKKGDIVEANLITHAKHDGTGGLYYFVELMRLVCTNGMKAPHSEKVLSIRHTASAQSKLLEAKEISRELIQSVEDFRTVSNILADIKLSQDELRAVVEDFYFEDDTNNIYTNTRKQNQARDILAIFGANDNDAFKSEAGTAWNLLNAFTNYNDHRVSYRTLDNEDAQTARLRATMFGSASRAKQCALESIVRIVVKNHKVSLPKSYIFETATATA